MQQIIAVFTIDPNKCYNKFRVRTNRWINRQSIEWFLDTFEQFCRHKALEKAILDSTDLLEKQDYGSVETKIKEASQVGLVKDLGLDYFENPKERLQHIKSPSRCN